MTDCYQLFKTGFSITCTNPYCSGYHLPLKGKSCPQCHRSLRTAEITDVEQKITFPTPYRTGYEAPVLKIELNPGVTTVIREEVARLRKNLTDRYGDNIPDTLKHLWTSAPDWLALHSMGHQLIFAVPLLVLSSRSDVNFVVEREDKRSVGYFFDTCDGGNGATEAIFQNLPRLADKARALVEACDCEYGCPRCLTQHGCPQRNEGLNRDLGLFLLKAIGESASSIE
jgi:DEAD/DEAH box helicase domain-containing protein